ncbi:hypothetical protein EC973_000701 [Apophysomyces ossiformis]|uniref:Uncharacterized protein n=1 Tax=Apophysomyces ossiformis TaxID=679940 RepID=A0A8H7BN39_9FUNG|nr:hypothetical protein EC973_000701 [Apophysomyces ossiformis]
MSAVIRCFSYFITASKDSWPTSSTIEKAFAIVDLAICLALWAVSATTPTELDQGELVDFDDEDDGVLVLHDGRVVRNGRILSLEASASPLSSITFGWMNALLRKAYTRPLRSDQLWALPLRLRAQDNYRRFNNMSGDLLMRIYKTNRKAVVLQFTTAIATVVFHYANPFFLRKLLNYLQDPKGEPKEIGYFYCVSIFLCSVASTVVASRTLLWGRRWHVTMTNMLNSEIYAHTLTLKARVESFTDEAENSHDLDDAIASKRASLMSQDTERLAELASYLHIFYTCPLEIGVGVVFLYHILGNAFLAGLIVMVVALPSTHYVNRRLHAVQKQLTEAKSWRIRLLKELCEGIKTTKSLAWERRWEQVIASARDDELVQLIKLYTQNAILGLIWYTTPVLVTTISFAWYTLVEHKTLDASTAFVSIVLFGMLRDPLNVLPQAFVAYSDAKVSLDHITAFLNSEEKRDSHPDSSNPYDVSSYSYEEQVKVGFNSGIFQWHPNDHKAGEDTGTALSPPDPTFAFRLVVPTFVFPNNKLSIITGQRQSGKTSLLCALLGEMAMLSGQSYIPSRFLQARTSMIRDPQNRALYIFRVAYAAQNPWIQSGTVRENILFSESWDDSRYRAVLYQCDLLRDLASLENGDLTLVGERGAQLTESQKQKISLARAVYSRAKTVLIDDVFHVFDQTVTDFLLTNCIRGELMQSRTVILATSDPETWACDAALVVSVNAGRVLLLEDREGAIDEWLMSNQPRTDQSLVATENDVVETLFDSDNAYADEDFFDESSVMRESVRQTNEGAREDHVSKTAAYASYFTACGGWQFWSCAIGFTILARLANISESYWLKEALLQSICHAPLQFFEGTPLSDIMNRFSKDIETVDCTLGWHVNFLLQTIFGVVGVVITIGVILPEFFIVSIIAAIVYGYIGMIYIRASRELKRLNADSRPPIYSLYSDTLTGLVTIRAYGEQWSMMKKMFQLLDDNMRPFYTLWTTNRWLFIRVEVLGACLSLFIGILLVFKMETMDAGLAGIALTFATSLLEYIYWLMRQSTTIDMHFESLERIRELGEMPQEPPGIVEGSRPPAAWPTAAAIQVRDLMVGYSIGDDLILRHVSFNILAGEKIAMIGRTGAEVNALVSCLFRFMDPLRGSIKIDGVNIAWVRSNLDPFGEYDDYELWQALYRVCLALPPSTDEVPNGQVMYPAVIQDLDMDLGKDGRRLPAPERQLLCIARALLRDCTKLVVIEEAPMGEAATETMDRVIQKEFEESTLIMIPYRLRSVMRYDRVMVFDQNDLIEFDKPEELLNDSHGLLRTLVDRTKSTLESNQTNND